MLSFIKRKLRKSLTSASQKTTKRRFNKITVVDDNDNVVGYKDLFNALTAGDIRRVSLVFIFSESGRLLLQKRADWVVSPNLYDQSAAGHVDEGDTYEFTARQELKEELRLELELTEVGVSLMTSFHANGIYKAVVPDDLDIPFNKDEVADVRWVTIQELESEMSVMPHTFASSFLEVWQKYRDKILEA